MQASYFIVSCTAPPVKGYKGARLDASQEAVLSAEGKHKATGMHKRTFIGMVDGKDLTYGKMQLGGMQFPCPHEVYVLPGQHTIKVSVQNDGYYVQGILWFDAYAGKKYIVRSIFEGYSARLWIEDDETKKPVGGIGPGSEYKPLPKVVEEDEDS